MTDEKKRAVLCPNCGKLISSSEDICPYCGLSKPTSKWKNIPWTKGISDEGMLIRTIIAINVAMYILSLVLYPRDMGMSMNPLTMLSPSGDSLILLGATGTYPIDQLGRWWSLVSANFLHGSVLHILFNMMALKQIAPLVIREFGSYRMLIIYTVGGASGFMLSYLAGIRVTIGASAAICSLIGAALYYGKSRGGVYGQSVFRQVGGWVIGLFIFGLLIPGINNWGHGGGLIGGALLGVAMGYHEIKKENITHKMLAQVIVAVTSLILAWAIITGLIFRIAG
ncbi:MAG: rhomboid family intramembrane serine protease [Desulfobacterales bacterium]|nr:rhomboid family intramembrane serine protease [Desulfobacterales bacterium]